MTVFASDISIGDAGLVFGMGYVTVFFGLILLMAVIYIVGRIMVAKQKSAAAAAPAAKQAAPAAPAEKKLAPGAAGELKLYNVDDRTAAMVMAITANKLQKPLNELRFKSIKEVK